MIERKKNKSETMIHKTLHSVRHSCYTGDHCRITAK